MDKATKGKTTAVLGVTGVNVK